MYTHQRKGTIIITELYIQDKIALSLELLYNSILIELLTMLSNVKIKSCNRIVLTLKDSKWGSEKFLVTEGGERSLKLLPISIFPACYIK